SRGDVTRAASRDITSEFGALPRAAARNRHVSRSRRLYITSKTCVLSTLSPDGPHGCPQFQINQGVPFVIIGAAAPRQTTPLPLGGRSRSAGKLSRISGCDRKVTLSNFAVC